MALKQMSSLVGQFYQAYPMLGLAPVQPFHPITLLSLHPFHCFTFHRRTVGNDTVTCT
jgi:hypothetical protein